MKFTSDIIPSLFIPLLGLGANNSNLIIPAEGSLETSLPANSLRRVATATVGAQVLFTHHPHHPHHGSRNENHYENEGEGEDGVRRPKAGQRGIKVHTKHEQQSSKECPQPPILSCSPQAAETDSCCVVDPGGVLVHAQFWDLGFGLADSWGIHGLWPDKCNNQFYENCDSSRAYSGTQITQVLQASGQNDLLDFMNANWVSNDESPPDFWSHEWATHGTCVSTLEPDCFTDYTTTQEVVPYFETVVKLFQQLDTYTALTSAGIEPSTSKTYDLTDLQDAVTKALGFVPDFTCTGSQLSTVQYYLNARGPLQDGDFVASHASRKSDCPKSGIKWPPKELNN